jgi:hypothetical protein
MVYRLPGYYRLPHFFQVDTDIIGYPGESPCIFIKLLLAPVAAEVIFHIFMDAGEFRILFIYYHQTDGIGSHDILPRSIVLESCFFL